MNSSIRTKFNADSIFQAIDQLGIHREGPYFDGEFRGGQCHVFKVNFKHDQDRSLAIRVPLYMDPDATIEALEAELRNYDELEAKGLPWAPKCHGRSLTFDNPAGYPFIVLSWIDGSKLAWTESFPQRPLRDDILTQMAKMQLDLIEYTLENSHSTTTEFFERLLRNRRSRVEQFKFADLSLQDCLDQQALLSTILGADGSDTALAMDHGDFKPENIIVDQEYNVKGMRGTPSEAYAIRKYDLTDQDLRAKLRKIPDRDAFPKMTQDITLLPPLSDVTKLFFKRPQIHCLLEEFGGSIVLQMFLEEVQAMEFLARHLHPNIVPYHGYVIKRGHVTGIALTRYQKILDHHFYNDASDLDLDRFERQCRDAIDRIHSLGLAHNDPRPPHRTRQS
ncbi:hypothetical protein LTR09_012743 [Extremus antarcticus]|uniref:Aminoglycoside phosphotransferase domain-containing protein n=1 Tax=Extremus antarcticus TaxID=702011 RepID=A0AAJ0D4P4_9PEZI|nr:hypothetical protein LTR09_012743 [Extremus antarcticus]